MACTAWACLQELRSTQELQDKHSLAATCSHYTHSLGKTQCSSGAPKLPSISTGNSRFPFWPVTHTAVAVPAWTSSTVACPIFACYSATGKLTLHLQRSTQNIRLFHVLFAVLVPIRNTSFKSQFPLFTTNITHPLQTNLNIQYAMLKCYITSLFLFAHA